MSATEQKIPVIVICGPTASGKTALAVETALKFGGEVISADSMQIYQGLSVATAKPTELETKGIEHHLVGFLPPSESYSAARFVAEASETALEIHSRGKLPVIAGGTGQYVSAFIDGLHFTDVSQNLQLRAELEQRIAAEGAEKLLAELRTADPEYAEKTHVNNHKRIIRGLEYYLSTGEPITRQNERSRLAESRFACRVYYLCFSQRELLYGRINERCERMLQNGLLEEARGVYEHKDVYSGVLQAIGYKEFFPYFEGTAGLDECAETFRRETRRYAKRQTTWFNSIECAVRLDPSKLTEKEMLDLII